MEMVLSRRRRMVRKQKTISLGKRSREVFYRF
jgi:hypothetical protein